MASHSLQTPEWLVFLRTLCALAEGAADVKLAPDSGAAACVITVLRDPQGRIAVMGGRDGMPRSLGSVFGGSVTRFLGGFRGGVSRVIPSPVVFLSENGVAVSRDGSTLVVSYCDSIKLRCVHTGVLLRSIGAFGSGPLQFISPRQVWIASDGFVFVADHRNHRIQVLTPRYDFHGFVGVGQLELPSGVCASDDVIVISELFLHRISVFRRSTGELLRRFGRKGSQDGELCYPHGLCFMSGCRRVAVNDFENSRVSVFALDGEFVRHVGVGKLRYAAALACSAADELAVADEGNKRIAVFNASGDIVWTSEAGGFISVAVHGSTIYGHVWDNKCVVFT